MKRALELASHGRGNTSPNPMVGAVIVHENRIVGEGYHRRCGEGHAEVNAVNSVKDPAVLNDSTMYVTLEPCSHYGKTPPCARLIIEKKIPRVVVGAVDPFVKVAGRGIAMLRDAGVEVAVGILADESRSLNARFFTAHTLQRPFITLKWAQSADSFMDERREDSGRAVFSNRLSTIGTHRLRALHDAILTTASTVNADNCRLNVRDWTGRQPRPVILDRRGLIRHDSVLLSGVEPRPLLLTESHVHTGNVEQIILDPSRSLGEIMHLLYNNGITSVLVEAGPTLLQSFINEGLWDLARVETSPRRLGERGTHPSPTLNTPPAKLLHAGDNTIAFYFNNPLLTTDNL